MNVLHNVVRVRIPELLTSVPIPDSFGGIFSLSRKYACTALYLLVKELLGLALFSGVSAALGYSVYFTIKARALGTPINPDIKKDQEKVVDFVDIESIGKKTSYCRCWKSKKVR